jgi:DNA polymerase III psi subunit
MQMNRRDQYLSALGITQWVSKSIAPVEPEIWQKSGLVAEQQDFAFVVETADLSSELLIKMIQAVGQTMARTLVYSSTSSRPDGLPVVMARHVIVLGYDYLHVQAPPSYYCAPSLSVISTNVDAKRALWSAMKSMMGAHV